MGGNDLLNGREGDDILYGGYGNDRFVYNLAATNGDLSVDTGGGRDVIVDFDSGEDKLDISMNCDKSSSSSLHVSGQEVFELLDSNNDHKLTAADQWVDQRNVNAGGWTDSALVLDIARGVGAGLFGAAGEHTLALLDVTSLLQSDFVLA
jgi:Ca2+-binding RTX toxin-like protein